MTQEQIEASIKKHPADPLFEIRFKLRNPIKGLFITTSDYRELKLKNLWRIVSENHIEEYNKSKNENLARIFNGTDFTRLEAKND